jgi:hypothetical protein
VLGAPLRAKNVLLKQPEGVKNSIPERADSSRRVFLRQQAASALACDFRGWPCRRCTQPVASRRSPPAADAEDYERGLLDAFDSRELARYGHVLDTEHPATVGCQGGGNPV